MNYGLIEGFYGPPWRWEARRSLAPFLAEQGYRFYIYAPKNDPFLRDDWRSDWTGNELRQLLRTAQSYRDAGLAWGMGLSPAGAWQEDISLVGPALAAKAGRLRDMGLDLLAILFDDMRGDVEDLVDKQVEIVARLAEAAAPARLLVCPTYYSDDPLLDEVFGRRPDGYLEELGRLLDPDTDIFWTGQSVMSADYPPGHLREVAGRIGRRPFLWDNYPVNDVARADFLHLRGFGKADAGLADLVAGHAVNPMLQARLSRIPLATLADRYRQGRAYDPQVSFRAALARLCSAGLAERLAEDARSFQERGRCAMDAGARERLAAAYAGLPDETAREVADWLATSGTRPL